MTDKKDIKPKKKQKMQEGSESTAGKFMSSYG